MYAAIYIVRRASDQPKSDDHTWLTEDIATALRG